MANDSGIIKSKFDALNATVEKYIKTAQESKQATSDALNAGGKADTSGFDKLSSAMDKTVQKSKEITNVKIKPNVDISNLEKSKQSITDLVTKYKELRTTGQQLAKNNVNGSNNSAILNNLQEQQKYLEIIKSSYKEISSIQGSKFSVQGFSTKTLSNNLSTVKAEIQDVKAEMLDFGASMNIDGKINTQLGKFTQLGSQLQQLGMYSKDAQSKLSQFANQLHALEGTNDVAGFTMLQTEIQKYTSGMQQAMNAKQKFDSAMNGKTYQGSGFDNLVTQADKLQVALKKGQISGQEFATQMNALSKSMNSVNVDKFNKLGMDTGVQVSSIGNMRSQMESYLATLGQGQYEVQSFNATTNQMVATLRNADGTITTTKVNYDGLSNTLRTVNSSSTTATAGMQTLGISFTNALKRLTAFAGGYQLLMKGYQELKEGLSFVNEMDSNLTTISMTMDTTSSGLENLGSSAIQMAQDMGTSASEVMNVAQIYANASETVDSILNKTNPTIMLANASGMSTTDASDTLQGITNQFTELAGQEEYVVDVLEKVNAGLAIDFSSGIEYSSQAITKAGSVAEEAGMSLEKFVALAGKVSEVSREEGNVVGNAFKTIFSRISRVTDTSDEALSASEVSKIATAYKSVGISVYDANGNFQDIDVTLGALSEKWDSLTDAQRSYIDIVYIA